MPKALPRPWLINACPTCKAPADELCFGPGGVSRNTRPHSARARLPVNGKSLFMRVTPGETDRAQQIVERPEYWCRARLFRALAAAKEKGVLEEVLDEMNVGSGRMTIMKHLDLYWKGKTL